MRSSLGNVVSTRFLASFSLTSLPLFKTSKVEGSSSVFACDEEE